MGTIKNVIAVFLALKFKLESCRMFALARSENSQLSYFNYEKTEAQGR